MTKRITLLLALLSLITLCACGKKEESVPSTTEVGITETQTEEGTFDVSEDPSHIHSFTEATCTEASVCHCGMEKEKAKGHEFSPATCTLPKTCVVCGETEGEPQHSGGKATCTTLPQCEICGVYYGEYAKHQYKGKKDIVCSKCHKVTRITYEIVDETVSITKCQDEDLKNLEIPKTIEGYPVTKIGDGAFENCTKLQTIQLHDTVTVIGQRAFYGCTALKKITLSENITAIGANAFSYCSALTEFVVPEGVSVIENETFWSCTALGNVTIPTSVKTISKGAFRYCTALERITLPKVEEIGDEAFSNCTGLKSITLSKELKHVGFWTFSGCMYLRDVMYEGAKKDRDKIEIDLLNDFLESAIWHYKVVIK